MSDDYNEERDEDEEEESGEDFETLPSDAVLLSGLHALNEDRIFGCGFVRSKGKPAQLNIEYAVDADSVGILSAPFERFFSEEAYYFIQNDEGVRVSTLILRNLDLVHMEINHDVDNGEETRIYMVYDVESFEQVQKK